MIKSESFIKSLGPVIAITGIAGSHKTLVSIILMKKEEPNLKIVSNTPFETKNQLEPLDINKIKDYKDSIIFYDQALDFRLIRFKKYEEEISKSIEDLKTLEENNNTFLFTTQSLEYIHPQIVSLVTTQIQCLFLKSLDRVMLEIRTKNDDKKLAAIPNVSKYYKYYNATKTIPYPQNTK